VSNDVHKRVVEEFFQALAVGDVDAVQSRLTDDATWWVAGDLPVSGIHKRSEIEPMVAGMAKTAVGPVTFTATSVVAEGNRVSVETESTAKLANGNEYSNKYHFAFEFDGAQISAVREYMDTLRAHRVMFE
jgi:ketosteroid isomerase-like protein